MCVSVVGVYYVPSGRVYIFFEKNIKTFVELWNWDPILFATLFLICYRFLYDRFDGVDGCKITRLSASNYFAIGWMKKRV